MLCESNLPEDFSGQRILTLLYPQDQRIPDQIVLNKGLDSCQQMIQDQIVLNKEFVSCQQMIPDQRFLNKGLVSG